MRTFSESELAKIGTLIISDDEEMRRIALKILVEEKGHVLSLFSIIAISLVIFLALVTLTVWIGYNFPIWYIVPSILLVLSYFIASATYITHISNLRESYDKVAEFIENL